jgi:hypothetical protein
MTGLPASTLRHFPAGAPDPATSEGRGALLGRLLEDGDREDLAALTATVGRDAIAAWVARHGRRRLSRRSRAFWTAVFGLDAPAADPAAEALWPLA